MWARQRYYASLTEALDAARATDEWKRRGFAAAEQDHKNGTWSGGTHDTCAQLATFGWPDGVAKASERATRIADRLVAATGGAIMTSLTADVMGCGYDVGAYVTGTPECWLRSEESVLKRAISIGTNIGVSAGISTDAMIARGIAVSALALSLNAAGYPVTIDIAYQTCTKRGQESTVIRIADASSGSPLDLDRAVFAMAHPTMFRLLIRSIVAEKDHGSIWDKGRVMSDTRPPDQEYDLYLSGMQYTEVERWRNPDAWIVAEYNRQTSI